MTWRPARSLQVLRAQINALAPNRSKSSDGLLGNEEHAARKSDHNPNEAGVVTAFDVTHDPAGGMDGRWLADALVASRDRRLKYIIYARQIISSKQQPWIWRPYNGTNAHLKHVHISVDADPALYDDESPWSLGVPVRRAPGAAPQRRTLLIGMSGPDVAELQRALGVEPASGLFRARTHASVMELQRRHGLVVDGVVGPKTWAVVPLK